jgi:hypothetical protein
MTQSNHLKKIKISTKKKLKVTIKKSNVEYINRQIMQSQKLIINDRLHVNAILQSAKQARGGVCDWTEARVVLRKGSVRLGDEVCDWARRKASAWRGVRLDGGARSAAQRVCATGRRGLRLGEAQSKRVEGCATCSGLIRLILLSVVLLLFAHDFVLHSSICNYVSFGYIYSCFQFMEFDFYTMCYILRRNAQTPCFWAIAFAKGFLLLDNSRETCSSHTSKAVDTTVK